MLHRLFYVILIVSCIVGIQADESAKKKSLQERVDDEIQKSMTRRSTKVEDKLKMLDNNKLTLKLWDMYKHDYNLTYSTPEENEKHLNIFIGNLKTITKINDPLKRTVGSFKVGLNKFAAMDPKDFIKQYTGTKPPLNSNKTGDGKPFADRLKVAATRRQVYPPSLDYRLYMNPIEDQSPCQSCAAFASTATIEGVYALKKNIRINLSKQQLVDCIYPKHCAEGFYLDKIFDYIKGQRGLISSQYYPYRGASPSQCTLSHVSTGAIAGYGKLSYTDEEQIKQILYHYGPLTAQITVTDQWSFYKTGIIDLPSCSKVTNHGVVIVGYGNEFGRDYWLVRNSWGTWWGEQGYFKIARNKNSMCGITSHVYGVIV